MSASKSQRPQAGEFGPAEMVYQVSKTDKFYLTSNFLQSDIKIFLKVLKRNLCTGLREAWSR